MADFIKLRAGLLFFPKDKSLQTYDLRKIPNWKSSSLEMLRRGDLVTSECLIDNIMEGFAIIQVAEEEDRLLEAMNFCSKMLRKGQNITSIRLHVPPIRGCGRQRLPPVEVSRTKRLRVIKTYEI